MIYKEWFWENIGETLNFILVFFVLISLTVYIYKKLKEEIGYRH